MADDDTPTRIINAVDQPEVTSNLADSYAITVICQEKRKTTKRIWSNLLGVWYAVLHLTVAGKEVNTGTVAALIGCTTGSASGSLRDLTECHLLIHYRNGLGYSYMLNNSTNREKLVRMQSKPKPKPQVKVAKDELKDLRDFRKQFEGIDPAKLRELMDTLS